MSTPTLRDRARAVGDTVGHYTLCIAPKVKRSDPLCPGCRAEAEALRQLEEAAHVEYHRGWKEGNEHGRKPF